MSRSRCRYTVVLQSGCEASEVLLARIAKQLHIKISFSIYSKISFPHRSISLSRIRFEKYVVFFDAFLKWWDHATSSLRTLNVKTARKFPPIPTVRFPVVPMSTQRYSKSSSQKNRTNLSRFSSATLRCCSARTNLSRFSSATLRCCSDSWHATSSETSDTHCINLSAFPCDNKWYFVNKWSLILSLIFSYFEMG